MSTALALHSRPFLLRARAKTVDLVKRRAIRSLHRTRRGEALLLGIYLLGEEGSEEAVIDESLTAGAPPWLAAQFERQLSDERKHARWLRERLHALGNERPTLRPDVISRWKWHRLRRIVRQATPDFAAGALVPLCAVAWRMEIMGVRVLDRHASTLAEHDPRSPTGTLLTRILADERQHVAFGERALSAIVASDERKKLAALVERIDRVERSFGVLGAILLWCAGISFRARARP